MEDSLYTVPYKMIVGAKNKDEEALECILKVFNPYITTLATEDYVDESGHYCSKTDHDMIAFIQSKLIMAVINKFQIMPDEN